MRAFLAGTLLVLAFAVAACGGGGGGSSTTNSSANGEASKSAQQVLTDAVTAADAASSLHLSGNVNASGKQIVIDLAVSEGKGATGTVALNGASVQLIVIGTTAYIKADGTALRALAGAQNAAAAAALAGHWLKIPIDNAKFAAIIGFSNPKALFDSLKSGADAQLKNDGAAMYQGQSVVALADGAKNGTLYVSATGTPYPVALVKTGSGGGTISFSEWNQPVSLSAPSGALDFSQLGG